MLTMLMTCKGLGLKLCLRSFDNQALPGSSTWLPGLSDAKWTHLCFRVRRKDSCRRNFVEAGKRRLAFGVTSRAMSALVIIYDIWVVIRASVYGLEVIF